MINDFMKKNYHGKLLDWNLWQSWPNKKAVDLAKGDYQFLANGDYNEQTFSRAASEAKAVIKKVFNTTDQVTLVLNKYLFPVSNVKDKIVNKIIFKRQEMTISASRFSTEDQEKLTIDQLTLRTTYDNINWDVLVKALLNQDFPDRRPRFTTRRSFFYPDVYLINEKEGTILHVYDDRGYELFFSSLEALKKFEG